MKESSLSGKAVVVGAGTMGGGIAADLANAGWTVHLLDVSRDAAAAGKERLLTQRPPLLFLPEFAERIAIGDTGADLHALASADWVVEAVAESMAVKRAVLSQIEAHIGPRTIVTSNTSGLGLAAMSAHCSADFRRRFFGTHFLNPPRYLKLLEVIPTPESAAGIIDGFVGFAEQILGHRVVRARDTPGFISTRLWITHLMDTIHTAIERGVTIETVDALTGPLIGRPRSATFRMADVVGLDIIAAVAANQYAALPDDPLRERLLLPEVMHRLIDTGRTGEKAGAGFYKREGKEILTFDLATLEYRPRIEPPVNDILRLQFQPLEERFEILSRHDDPADDHAYRFIHAILDRLLRYVEAIGPEIADDVLSIDRTLQWGFGWDRGPFAITDHWKQLSIPNYSGALSNRTYRTFSGRQDSWPEEPEYIDLAACKRAGRSVEETPEASLIDIGDGVFCLEFHTKMNTLNPQLCRSVRRAILVAAEGGIGLIIGNQGAHFSVGYDLGRLIPPIERKDFGAIHSEMHICQDAFLMIKYAAIPVIAAVHGFALGGGGECALHCAAIQAAPELAMGLPELLVGVIPCGGGIKEVLIRALERLGPDADPLEAARAALRTLILPRPSANAYEAQRDGWLRPTDRISHNADRRLYEAKQRVVALALAEYRPPQKKGVRVTGAAGLVVLRADIDTLRTEGCLTDYDAHIADRIACVLCGGDEAMPGIVAEQHLLDLERAIFLELCRRPETLARMRHLLETGKHLRN